MGMPPDSAEQTNQQTNQPIATPPQAATAVATGQPTQQQVASPKEEKPANPSSTQNTLLIAEIRESMVIMKDSSYRAVLSCESINFDLMSEQEREGVEYSYQSFLNSLSFPVQILVRSQRVDIGPYVDQLVSLRNNQDNMLLNVLMDDYINFIDILSQEANIMDKAFYIVIPYYPTGDISNVVGSSTGFFKQLFGKQSQTTKISSESYTKAKDELGTRINLVQSGLSQVGIRNSILDTNQLSQLYYNTYNPDIAVRQPLTDPEAVSSVYVKKATPAEDNS